MQRLSGHPVARHLVWASMTATGLVCLAVAAAVPRSDAIWLALIGLVTIAAGLAIHWAIYRPAAGEAWLETDRLVLHYGDRELSVPLAAIERVHGNWSINPEPVRLRLGPPFVPAMTVFFIAPIRWWPWWPWGSHPLVVELNRQVKLARQPRSPRDNPDLT